MEKKDSLELLLRLMNILSDDSLIYADITYNTKPMSAMILYVMQYIEKVKDVEVCGIYYGEILREKSIIIPDQAKIYILTPFKYLNDVMEQLLMPPLMFGQLEIQMFMNHY